MSTKPDSDNYLDRITGIQKAIITGSQAAKYPIPAGDVPYWQNTLLPPRRISPNTDSNSQMVTFSCQMLLVRGNKTSMFQEEVEAQIIADRDDVLWEFMTNSNYRSLIVGAFTAVQPGFITGGLRIDTLSRTEIQQSNTGELLGSFYNLSWQHKMKRDVGT